MKRSAATSNTPIDLMNSPGNVQALGSTRERPGVSGVSYSLWSRSLAADCDDSMDIRDAIPSPDDENVSSDTLLLCAAKIL